jgi:membrane associated rhomboid family serine protease
MLYDRPYMRYDPGKPEASKASMVTTLLVVTISVFVLQQVLQVFFPSSGGRPNTFLSDWFALSVQHFSQLKVWTLLSYGFLHSSGWASFFFIPIPFAHLIFNMLGLYFLGRPVEAMLGRSRFLALYLAAIVLGGVVFLVANFNGPNVVVGASAGVLSIVTVFCLLEPNRQLILFPIPIPVKSRWVLWGILAFSLFGLSGEISGRPGIVAHSAHLGGMLAGFLYVQFVHRGNLSFGMGGSSRPAMELPDWFKRKQKPVARKMSYKVNRTDRGAVQREVDRILDKINQSGFASLTEHEKRTLDDAKDLLR